VQSFAINSTNQYIALVYLMRLEIIDVKQSSPTKVNINVLENYDRILNFKFTEGGAKTGKVALKIGGSTRTSIHIVPYSDDKLKILGLKEVRLKKALKDAMVLFQFNNLLDKAAISIINLDGSTEAYSYDIENAALYPFSYKKAVRSISLLNKN